MHARPAQKYLFDHLAELRSDVKWIRAHDTHEDKDYQFFEADTTSRVQVLLHALKARASFQTKVARNLARHVDTALDWAEQELKQLDAAELQAVCKTCRQITVEDAAHRAHRKKVLSTSSRSSPKTALPDLNRSDKHIPTAETMTIREFCASRQMSGKGLNRAMERIRKRLESRGVKPQVAGRPAKKGQSAIPRRYAEADLTEAFDLDEPGREARK